MSKFITVILCNLFLYDHVCCEQSLYCHQVFQKNNLSDNFPNHVGHAIHAITLTDLKKFEPSTDENNRVPTINRSGKTKDPILYHTPDIKIGDETDFRTEMIKSTRPCSVHHG